VLFCVCAVGWVLFFFKVFFFSLLGGLFLWLAPPFPWCGGSLVVCCGVWGVGGGGGGGGVHVCVEQTSNVFLNLPS